MEAGFIGLGAMGSAMAANLLAAGHQLRVWNRSRLPVEELARKGAEPVSEARMACTGTVFSMLADDEAVRGIFLAPDLLEEAPPGTIHVNMATISVRLAEELAAEHRRHGVGYVSAAFGLVLGLKDLRLLLEAAEGARTPMPFASVLRDHLLEAVAQGEGDRDWAALADVARRHAGL
ncbi:MAG: NAD(P)-binding domain-containing protein [Gemmatimonadales bacterium]|nr:NAD(P)-binding domain-containing protein [Gemmatimonadales bacterium]